MATIKETLDRVLTEEYKKGKLYDNNQFRAGFLEAIDNIILNLDISLTVFDIDDMLDYGHNAIFHLNDKRLYRLDTVSDKEGPFIEPIPQGYGGKKRYATGTKLNGLFPGVIITSPHIKPKS